MTYRTVAPASACCDMATNGSPRHEGVEGTLLSAETNKATEAVRPVATRSVLQR